MHTPAEEHNGTTRVLVADDDAALLKVVTRELERRGCACTTARTGLEALRLLVRQPFEVTLLDLNMPEVDGYGVLSVIREEEVQTVPVVLTGVGDIQSAVKALSLGAFDFLEKPSDPATLVRAVQRAREHGKALAQGRQMAALARYWEATFDALPDAVVAVDGEGRIVRCNAVAAALAGDIPHNVAGRHCHHTLCADTHGLAECPFLWADRDAAPASVTASIGDRVFEVSSVPVTDGEGVVVSRVSVARDCTERRRAAAALAESEERFRVLFTSSRDAIMTLDPGAGHYTSCNQACLDMFGVHHESDFLRLGPVDLSPERQPGGALSAARARAFIRKAVVAGGHDFEWTHCRVDGGEFPTSVQLTRFSLGGRVLLQATVRDITERRRQEDVLRDREETFRAMTDVAQDAILMMDGRGRITFYNRAAEDVFGWTAREALGKNLHLLLAPAQYRPQYVRALAHFLRSGEGDAIGKSLELEACRKDHAVFPIEMSLSSVHLRGAWHAVGIVRDISERKEAEAALQRALGESRTQAGQVSMLLRSARAVLDCEDFRESARQVFDACREVTGATAGYVALLSESGEENEVLFLESGGVPCDVDPALPMPVRGLRAQAYHLKHAVYDNDFAHSEWAQMLPGGHVSLRNVLFAPLVLGGEAVGLLGLANKAGDFTDVDARLATAFGQQAAVALRNSRAREALRASEEKVRQIVENIGIGVTLVRNDLRVLEVNRQMRAWFPELSAEGAPLCREAFGRAGIDTPCDRCPVKATLGDGLVHEGTVSAPGDDGRSFRVVSSPIHDKEGRVVGAVQVMEDVTERQRLERELNQAQKLEAVGRLAAGIAHEINTPTQYVGDNIEFLQTAYASFLDLARDLSRTVGWLREGTPPTEVAATLEARRDELDLDYLGEQVPRALEQSVDGVGRIASIVRAMKEFSHPGSAEKTQVDLNACIESTALVSRNEWKYVAELETALDPQLPLVTCLPGELNQVILNMIVNAAHAIAEVVGEDGSEKGRITVGTRHDDGRVWIDISDTGAGIPETLRDRIFDPFFTTKEVGRGTGQGLAIARSVVVDKHGGAITVESAVGRGTTFHIELPVDPAQGTARPAADVVARTGG